MSSIRKNNSVRPNKDWLPPACYEKPTVRMRRGAMVQASVFLSHSIEIGGPAYDNMERKPQVSETLRH